MVTILEAETLEEAKEILADELCRNKDFIIEISLEAEGGDENGCGK